MTIKKEEILQKYEEFAAYLQTIDVEGLKEHYSRTELKELEKDIYAIKLRSVAYELVKLTDEMKKEEFPQLLGVHRYPVIHELSFLSEQEKINLDKEFEKYRRNDYLSSSFFYDGLEGKSWDEKEALANQVKETLTEKEVLQRVHQARCPHCGEGYVSRILTDQDREEIEKALNMKVEEDERYEMLEKHLHYNCEECYEEMEFESLKKVSYHTRFKLVKERDKTLDHV